MKPGLVSITFRKLSPKEIIALCHQHGLTAIEWGGDVHVPHGDLSAAGSVRELTEQAGLETVAYGSYFKLGVSAQEGLDFSTVLDTAEALGTRIVRIWTSARASADVTPDQRRALAEEALACADRAAARGMTICYEYHDQSMMDSIESARDFLAATEHPAIKTLWQPPHAQTLEHCLASLRDVLPRLQHVHVFHWWPGWSGKLPLIDGADRWPQYLQVLREAGRDDIPVLMEYVKDDSLEIFAQDAATLRAWVASDQRAQ